MHKAHDEAHSGQTRERGEYTREHQRDMREGENVADIFYPKDPATVAFLCERVLYKIKEYERGKRDSKGG